MSYGGGGDQVDRWNGSDDGQSSSQSSADMQDPQGGGGGYMAPQAQQHQPSIYEQPQQPYQAPQYGYGAPGGPAGPGPARSSQQGMAQMGQGQGQGQDAGFDDGGLGAAYAGAEQNYRAQEQKQNQSDSSGFRESAAFRDAPRPKTTLRCKLIVAGDTTVGKSALVQVFHSGKPFPKQYLMTTGFEIAVKEVKIPDSDTVVELFIVDSPGSPLYAAQRAQVWQGFNAVLVCFDLSRKDTFENAKKWIEELKQVNRGSATLRGILLGTKSDLAEFTEIKSEEANALAEQNGLAFMTCSTLALEDIDVPFHFIAASFDELYRNTAAAMAKDRRH